MAMKPGIFELSKVRLSDIKEALPRYIRGDTRKSMEKEILAKARHLINIEINLSCKTCFFI